MLPGVRHEFRVTLPVAGLLGWLGLSSRELYKRHREPRHHPRKTHDGERGDEEDCDPVLKQGPEQLIEEGAHREGDGWDGRGLAGKVGKRGDRQKNDEPDQNVRCPHDVVRNCSSRAKRELE